jgi:nickel superoxide dismutase
MVMRIQSLPPPDPQKPETEVAYQHSLARYIAVKEHHAELCKRELDILWHDYFKPEHLAKYPDLHTLFWNTLKLASRCKQTVDRKAAEDLVAAVDRIAEIFWETKGIKYADPYAQARFGT